MGHDDSRWVDGSTTHSFLTATEDTHSKGFVRYGVRKAKGKGKRRKTETDKGRTPHVSSIMMPVYQSLSLQSTNFVSHELPIMPEQPGENSPDSIGRERDEHSPSSSRRLRLEHTYNQERENFVQIAVYTYRTARLLPATLQSRRSVVLQSAKHLNSVLKRLGSEDEQIGAALLGACCRVQESPIWQMYAPDNLTPIRAMNAIQSSAQAPYVSKLQQVNFSTGRWAGRKYSIQEIEGFKVDQRWDFIAPAFVSYLATIQDLVEQIYICKTLQMPPTDPIQHLTSIFSEYWTVNVICTLTDYVDSPKFAAFQTIPDNYCIAPEKWHALMIDIEMIQLQLAQCTAAKQYMMNTTQQLLVANEQLYQEVQEVSDLHYSQANEDRMLGAVEEIRKNDLMLREMCVEAAHVLLFKIFTPFQSAFIVGHIQTTSQSPIAHWKDWMTIFYNFLTSQRESQWMDTYAAHLAIGAPEVAPISTSLTMVM